jgi:hypothetical protein
VKALKDLKGFLVRLPTKGIRETLVIKDPPDCKEHKDSEDPPDLVVLRGRKVLQDLKGVQDKQVPKETQALKELKVIRVIQETQALVV